MSRAAEIADRLRGTIGYPGDMDDIGDLTTEEAQELDQLVFCCGVCGWWLDVDEVSECETETTCVDCEDNKC